MIERNDNDATGRPGRVPRSRTPRVNRRHVCALAAASVVLAACGSSSGDDSTAATDQPAEVDSSFIGPPVPDTEADVENSVVEASAPAVDAVDSTIPESTAPESTEVATTEVVPDRTPLWELGAQALAPAGTVRLPNFGGIQLELEQEREVVPTLGSVVSIRLERDPAVEVNLVMVTETSNRERIKTAEEFLDALADHVGVDMAPIGEVTTPIGPAQGFEFSGFDTPTSREEAISDDNFLFAGPEWIWIPSPVGQMWMVDTERGPILVLAEGQETGPLLDEAIVTLDRVLETIEFADLDQPAG